VSTYAFAKTDAMFQAMLNGDNEDVAALCEARLKVKSTTERTRAQRFLDISQRGTLPVPLSYYGAATGRWTASKGSAINMQNLKRGSFLRKAIMAPEGYQLVVGDLSQIEPRVLAWMADYEDMLDIFRAGGDPYAAFGAQMFNIPGMTKDSRTPTYVSRPSPLYLVVSDRTPGLDPTRLGTYNTGAGYGYWFGDGENWVCHQGVVPQGEKEVLTALGVSATSDHEILTEHGWAEWSEVLASPSLLKSARASASLPVSTGTARCLVDSILLCSAPAGGRGLLIDTTLLQDALHAATPALRERLSRLDGNAKGISLSVLIDGIVIDCWTALAPSLCDVQTQKVRSIQTMEGVELRYTRRGLKTALLSYATSLGLWVGTSRHSNWTALTTVEGTNPNNLRFVTRSENGKNRRPYSARAIEELKQRIAVLETENADLRYRLRRAKK
jgi:hypothetical protein